MLDVAGLIDRKAIPPVKVVDIFRRAIRQAEVAAAKTMIERTEKRFDIKPKRKVRPSAGPSITWTVLGRTSI